MYFCEFVVNGQNDSKKSVMRNNNNILEILIVY